MPSYTEDDEVMKSRMELAELAIQRQRDRKAKEKAAIDGDDAEEEDGGGKVRHSCPEMRD
jgi:hypothetical protein